MVCACVGRGLVRKRLITYRRREGSTAASLSARVDQSHTADLELVLREVAGGVARRQQGQVMGHGDDTTERRGRDTEARGRQPQENAGNALGA